MDLDDLRPYGDNYSKVSGVMTEILSAHLSARLTQFVKRIPKLLREGVPTSFLFSNEQALQDAIVASEGNIRDFILICAKVYSQFRKEKGSSRFEQPTIHRGISEHFKLQKWAKVQDDDIRKSFINICLQVHSSNQYREIRIRDTTSSSITDILTKLREARLLHPSRDPLIIEGKWYRFFIVDYSGYLFIQSEYPHKFPSSTNDFTPNLRTHPDKILEIPIDNLL